MKKFYLLGFMAALLFVKGFAQQSGNNATLTSNIKGVIIDADSKKPLAGATIMLAKMNKQVVADANGEFILSNIPVGKQTLEVTMMGYELRVIGEVGVTSGKEVSLTVAMTEVVNNLGNVTLAAGRNRIKANNEFATASSRSFSLEDAKRYPAAAFDPGRMAQNFAGVSNAGDGSNEIVVRGNSPKGVLWRLEGVEIPSPNHFGSLGASGGAISMLSSSTLGSSDFYTGAFPAEFGNATSGVFDLTFRNGNKDKKEYSFMAGLLGIEFAAEGPFKKGGEASYLVNYRYSTLSLMKNFLDIGGVSPDYQDLSFKFNFPTKKAGTFSLFGIGGLNKAVKSPAKDSAKWTDDDPNFVLDAPGQLGVAGLSHQVFLNSHSYIKTVLSASGMSYKALIDSLNPNDGYGAVPIGNERNIDIAYRGSILYNNKINGRNTLRLGVIGSRLQYDYTNRYYDDIDKIWKESIAAEGNSMYYQAYLQWKYRISNAITFNSGVHASYLSLNETKSIEPRAALTIKASKNRTFTLAAGLHAKPEHLSTYNIAVFDPIENGMVNNRNLKMNKALHLVAGYEKQLKGNVRFKTEVYYQYLYDVAVERKRSSDFSILNATSFYNLTDIGQLVSNGTGQNYGIDVSAEKSFNKNYFFLITGSLFRSLYTNYDGDEFNTTYNRNYQLNMVTGKEWKRGNSNNKTWGLNAKVLTSGGLRESPIDLEASKARGKVMYVPGQYYTISGTPYFRFDVGVSFKRNRKHSTHTFMIDVQNLTGQQNVYTSYYDNKTQSVKKAYQLGFFPFMNYRIEFN